MPSAVNGLTNAEAPSFAVVPAGNTIQSASLATRYCAYIPGVRVATVFPRSACASAPAFTTLPAPSLPTGSAWSSRPATPARRAFGTDAVRVGRSAVPPARIVERSAGPSNRPRSDGLIGEASMRTTTSSAAGSGTGTSSSHSASSPLELIFDRSSRLDTLLGAECVLDAVEERLLFDLIAAGAPVLLEQLALAFAELGRHDDVDGDELVALGAAAHAGHPAPAQPIDRAGLRSGRHLQRQFAVERGDVHLAAERRLRERDRHVDQHVQPIAPEEMMAGDAQVDVEVAVGTAAHAGLAAAGDADARTVVDARRDADLQRLLLLDAAAAAAIRTRRLHDLPVAAALGAGRLRDELSERRLAHLALNPAPAAAVARNDQRAGLGAAAAAGRARGEMPEGDLAGRPGVRFLERDLDVVAQVAAARRAVAPLLLPAARRAEEHVEDVAEALGTESEAAAALTVDARVAEAIVVGPLLRVGEDLVRLVDLLEVSLGGDFVLGDVGMILARQLAIGALDRMFVGVTRDAEDVVVVSRHV